jgi:hypothetical protein
VITCQASGPRALALSLPKQLGIPRASPFVSSTFAPRFYQLTPSNSNPRARSVSSTALVTSRQSGSVLWFGGIALMDGWTSCKALSDMAGTIRPRRARRQAQTAAGLCQMRRNKARSCGQRQVGPVTAPGRLVTEKPQPGRASLLPTNRRHVGVPSGTCRFGWLCDL